MNSATKTEEVPRFHGYREQKQIDRMNREAALSITIPLPPEPRDEALLVEENSYLTDMSSIIERYLQPYSEHTVACYRNDMSTFFRMMNRSLMEVTELDILRYVEELEEAGPFGDMREHMNKFKKETI